MVIEVNGEQPFQLISGGFAITPPKQDYKLMYSVDGEAFYEYASYPAGTPLTVTNCIPNMRFMLLGNRDRIQVLM